MNKNQVTITGESYIKGLIAQGEHQQLDFKFAVTDSRKIARTLAAFSNTDGGKLLIGVKDNGSIAGVRSEEEYYMIEAAAQMYCKPQISFEVSKWFIGGKTVLEISIPKINTPCYAKNEENKWLAYIRVNDQNILANKVLLEVWKRKTKPKGTFIAYSQAENELLSFLNENENITLSKFTRIAQLTSKEAEKTLINLICLNVIDIKLSEKGAVYCLRSNN